MGTRPERAVETVGDLGLGNRDRGVSKSNTHARFRSGFQRQAARGHGRGAGGQRWKVKAVEFTGSRSSPGLTRQPALSSPTPAHLFSRDTMPTVQRKGTAHQQNVTAYQALV